MLVLGIQIDPPFLRVARIKKGRGGVEILSLQSVDLVVTEPFLGPPLRGSETNAELAHNDIELTRLYLSAFQNFKKILKPGGTVVFIIPRFRAGSVWITISNKLLPDIKRLGFLPIALLPTSFTEKNFLLYHRPAQKVGREIWKFKLH